MIKFSTLRVPLLLLLACVTLSDQAGAVNKRGNPTGISDGGQLSPLREVVASQPITVSCKPAVAKRPFTSQLHASLDIPVGDAIKLRGLNLPARVTAAGALELSLSNNGQWRTVAPGTNLAVQLHQPTATGKSSLAIKLAFSRDQAGVWTYRNATPLELKFGKEAYWLVDVNGNGVYNEPQLDGIALAGSVMLWPLPAVNERWASDSTDLGGLSLLPWGEEPRLQGHPLSVPSKQALAMLQDTNHERLRLGLPPRPAAPLLNTALQQHCDYMAKNNRLDHDEQPGTPGYTLAGATAGSRANISSSGPQNFSAGQMENLYHRFPHLLPHTIAFGVGVNGRFCGIDARSSMGKWLPEWGPVLCPAPGQEQVPLQFRTESPDPMKGDVTAGFPISAIFGTGRLKIVAATLHEVKAGQLGAVVPCVTFDPVNDALIREFMPTYGCSLVAMIATDPLQRGTTYEVTWELEVDGEPWTRTYRFST